MRLNEKYEFKTIVIVLAMVIVPIVTLIIAGYTFSANINPPSEELNASEEYIYHIVVSYNDIRDDNYYSVSPLIHIEDKLPSELTFVEFVQKTNNDLTPISKDGSYYSCSGNVVDGVDGLHYDENTRTISFDVQQLNTYCYLTIGVKVLTPTVNGRKDFYNTATATLNGRSFNSNVVHSYVGDAASERHSVRYRVTGVDSSVAVPSTKEYTVGQTVSIDSNPSVYGYIFNGWTSSDVTISNGTFTMPTKDVEIVGTFVPNTNPKYKLKLTTNISEDGLILPNYKEFYAGDTIDLYTVFGSINNYYEMYINNNYYLMIDAVFSDNSFTINDQIINMPAHDLTINVIYEKMPTLILYDFNGYYRPLDVNLPASTATLSQKYIETHSSNFDYIYNNPKYDGVDGYSIHYSGDKFTLPNYKSTTCNDERTNETVKCRFLGWLYNDEVIVSDYSNNYTVIKGTWMKINGTFTPEMSMEIIDPKDTYKEGDTVRFKTTIKNTSNIDIVNLLVNNNLPGQQFDQSNNYTIDGNYIKIDKIDSNGTIELYSSYVVGENKNRTITNELVLLSAEADNEYYLENDIYKASANFTTQSVGNNDYNSPTNQTNEQNQTVETNETNQTTDKNQTILDLIVPKTLDDAYIYIILAVISLTVIVTIVILFIRNKKNSK